MGIEYPSNVFLYSGKWYKLVATLYDVHNREVPIDLQGNGIVEFDYESSLNSLCFTGSLMYDDIEGKVVNYLNVPFAYMSIVFALFNTKPDDMLQQDETNADHIFKHTFIVDNIKITERNNNIITYKFILKSINFFNFASTISYSNYDSEPLPILSILTNCLQANASDIYTIDNVTFSQSMDNVKINYITNGNDNSFTTSNYLLNKLFYYSEKDESMKFLRYDETLNLIQLVDLQKLQFNLDKIDNVIMSMFKGNEEALLYENKANLATLVKYPTSWIVQAFKGTSMKTYNYETNEFSSDYINMHLKMNYHNAFIDSIMHENMLVDIPYRADLPLRSTCSYWNNNMYMYNDICNKLFNDNSLIIATTGNIERKPGNVLQLSIPNNHQDVVTYEETSYKDMLERFKNLEGFWISSKVHHYISTAGRYYQLNLVLFKNFIATKL